MNSYIRSVSLLSLIFLSSCSPKDDSHLTGIIGTDDSVEVQSVPTYAVSIIQKIDSKRTSYCNGVKLRDGSFLSALHCLQNIKPSTPISTSGGIVKEISRKASADLFIGATVGGVAPSEGATLYTGDLPLDAELEAYWFDPVSKKWKLSKGHGHRRSPQNLVWTYDLDLNPGASGAGLFIVNSTGERVLVGIHLGFGKEGNIGIALGQSSNEEIKLADHSLEGIQIQLCDPYIVDDNGVVVGGGGDCPKGSGNGSGNGGSDNGSEGGSGDGGSNGGPDNGSGSGDSGSNGDQDNSSGQRGGDSEGDPSGTGNSYPQGVVIVIGSNTSSNESGVGGGGWGREEILFQYVGTYYDGKPCYGCQVASHEFYRNSYFKPEFDRDSGPYESAKYGTVSADN